MNESTPPIHPTDDHPEKPATSRGLDTADSDKRVEEARRMEAETAAIPELTPDELEVAREQARKLRDRYSNNPPDSDGPKAA